KGWTTTGNAGTNATTNFLGTTDNIDLVFRTNNTERMRVDNTGNVGIGTNNPGDRLHVVGDILLTGGVRNIEVQNGDQNIQIDDANPTWNGDNYGGVTRFFGDGTLASSKLEAGGLELQRNLQVNGLAGTGNRPVFVNANGL